MNDELHNYIRQAKDSGDDHQAIHGRLVSAGWHPRTVSDALDKQSPQQLGVASVEAAMDRNESTLAVHSARQQNPIGVVKVFSTRGVEYYLMLITLVVCATALGTLLLNLAQELFGDNSLPLDPSVMAFTAAALIVAFPIFSFLFLRLKKAELLNPQLRYDQSRRRVVQIALIGSFIIGLLSTIGYLFVVLAAVFSGSSELDNIGLMIADFVVTIAIVGGIFAYFWLDSHRKGDQ